MVQVQPKGWLKIGPSGEEIALIAFVSNNIEY
jgi:hypothetical protein